MKTSKIAFFFRKSFGFLSNFSRRRSGALQSCVFTLSSIRPFYVQGVSTATILSPQGDPMEIIGRPRCDCATFSASLRRLYGDYCVITTMLLRLWRLPRTSPGLSKNAEFLRLFCACSKYSPTVCDLVRPWVPRYNLAASLLRPWRLCCVLDRSKVAVRTQ